MRLWLMMDKIDTVLMPFFQVIARNRKYILEFAKDICKAFIVDKIQPYSHTVKQVQVRRILCSDL